MSKQVFNNPEDVMATNSNQYTWPAPPPGEIVPERARGPGSRPSSSARPILTEPLRAAVVEHATRAANAYEAETLAICRAAHTQAALLAAEVAPEELEEERDAYRAMVADLLAVSQFPVGHPAAARQWERARELLKTGKMPAAPRVRGDQELTWDTADEQDFDAYNRFLQNRFSVEFGNPPPHELTAQEFSIGKKMLRLISRMPPSTTPKTTDTLTIMVDLED